MEKTAKPVQARSVKTREKLLKAALVMYSEKGYHSTTVDEIAAKAGVSTGIAYRYFRNKKDMLLSAISYGAEQIKSIAGIGETELPGGTEDLRSFLGMALRRFEELHIKYRGIHEELEGLRHTDEEVRRLYGEITRSRMEEIIDRLRAVTGEKKDLREKAYLAVELMEQHCHMRIDCRLYGLDLDAMREMTIDAVMFILA